MLTPHFHRCANPDCPHEGPEDALGFSCYGDACVEQPSKCCPLCYEKGYRDDET